MGVGKTTVGRLCAQQLGYDFVDADNIIVEREGVSIPVIFEQKGEDYFRQIEAELVHELCLRNDIVIATGGGMIVNTANRHALLRAGVCIGLTATPEAILQRVNPSTRPMLRGDDPRVRVMQLLKERAPAYRELHYTVDTTTPSPEQTAAQVVAIYRAEQNRIAVHMAGATYDIIFGDGVIDHLGYALAGRYPSSSPCAIVTDDQVGPLHADRVQQALRHAGIPSFIHQMPAGESHKTLHSVEGIYRALSEHGVERSSAVIAVGGGVVGDVTGFAAATYLRGVPFVQVPTSLLAMADSSIGGKTGVDTDFGKNLVGAFKQPDLVVMDAQFLRTLPPIEIRCGYAEIIKAALISGGAPWQRIRAGGDAGIPTSAVDTHLLATLLDAIMLKRDVVEEDPYEKGRRALLNLGHTFGHGLESWSHFSIKHGEGVSLGIVCAARLSQALGICDGALVEEITALLDNAGLPVSLPAVDADAIWQLMQSDKKKLGGKLRFIVLRAPGDIFITSDITEQQAKNALRSLVENIRTRS